MTQQRGGSGGVGTQQRGGSGGGVETQVPWLPVPAVAAGVVGLWLKAPGTRGWRKDQLWSKPISIGISML